MNIENHDIFRPVASNLTLHSDNQPSIKAPELNQCRICLENEINASVLISPCRCQGSVKYIHEECLKTWLVSQEEDLEQGQCELCKTKYKMEFIVRQRCNPRNTCGEGLTHCLFIPLLTAVLGLLVLIIYLLADRYLAEAERDDQKGYTIALIIACGVSGSVMFILVINSFKTACLTKRMEEWHIYSQEFPHEEAVENKDEDTSKEDTTTIMQNIQDPTTLRQRSEIITEIDGPLPVFLIPPVSRFSGSRIETPSLQPVLSPILKKGKPIAFTPKRSTYSQSVSRCSSIIQTPAYSPYIQSPTNEARIPETNSIPLNYSEDRKMYRKILPSS